MTTLQGTYIDRQPYVLVPLKTLIALLGRNAPVKLLMPPVVFRADVAVDEMAAMDADREDIRQHGALAGTHWRGGWRVE
jgi:hypothetical protein